MLLISPGAEKFDLAEMNHADGSGLGLAAESEEAVPEYATLVYRHPIQPDTQL